MINLTVVALQNQPSFITHSPTSCRCSRPDSLSHTTSLWILQHQYYRKRQAKRAVQHFSALLASVGVPRSYGASSFSTCTAYHPSLAALISLSRTTRCHLQLLRSSAPPSVPVQISMRASCQETRAAFQCLPSICISKDARWTCRCERIRKPFGSYRRRNLLAHRGKKWRLSLILTTLKPLLRNCLDGVMDAAMEHSRRTDHLCLFLELTSC
ncbi:hypothetical protein F4808DRAFT_71049 [Astrocystis sublimbata]|nr:hypothetical protein F4808DRAFT_71049 [Astrocystis sublimbata]